MSSTNNDPNKEKDISSTEDDIIKRKNRVKIDSNSNMDRNNKTVDIIKKDVNSKEIKGSKEIKDIKETKDNNENMSTKDEYLTYEPSFEKVLDALLYHPKNRARFQRRWKSGYYFRMAKGLKKPLETLTKVHLKDYDLYYIAQSHADAAWLWPVIDTKMRIFKTIYKAIEHLELYPFFKFSFTSPQYYDWVRTYMPDHYEKVKKFVKEGRWEPVGGMWIEPTLDEVWGESLVRQRLYGQLYYLREFGKLAKIESLLDVFGFPASLPQILIKSGATAFWTTKCTWNDTNPWPIANYMWEGIDGSKIFTHHFKFNIMAMLDLKLYRKMARFPINELSKDTKNEGLEIDTDGQIILGSNLTNKAIESSFNPDGEHAKSLGVFYGWGDGARGPWEWEIAFFQTLVQMGIGKFCTMEEYFDILRKEIGNRLPVWRDEMYLEYHRGCKTTQAPTKYLHRRAELWAFSAETFITYLNLILPDSLPYNKKEIFEIWRKILFNEFHDILPGSSIPDVYQLAEKELSQAINNAQDIIDEGFNKIEKAEDELLVFNPWSWDREEYINTNEGLFLVKAKPISITSLSKKETKVEPLEWNTLREGDFDFFLENDLIRATISKETGTLKSIYYKPLQKEMLTTYATPNLSGSALLVFHEDPFLFPAWNLDRGYPKNRIEVLIKSDPTIKKNENDELIISTEYKFLNSSAKVDFWLRPKEPFIRLKITTDMKDPKLLVKYYIPINLDSPEITAEIPYGAISRKRVKKTEMEKAKWEMPMQKWIDISDPEYGISIFNRGNYGFASTKRGIYLTITRTPKYPSPGYYSTYRTIPKNMRPKFTDLRKFSFEFGIYPHKFGWQKAQTIKWSYSFNQPLLSSLEIKDTTVMDKVNIVKRKKKQTDDNNTVLKSEATINSKIKDIMRKPLIEIDSDAVLLGALKPSEWMGNEFEKNVFPNEYQWDKKSFVIRLIEQNGYPISTSLQFHPKLKIHRVREVDLLEMHPSAGLKISNNKINIKFKPYEIKTFLVALK